MSEERPWWLSDPTPQPGWSGLLAQAQKMVTWVSEFATEQILAPHSTHDEPSEHPECALCQAAGLIAGPSGAQRERITWVDARWTT